MAEIFDHKVAEASLTPPKLGLTGRRENGRAPRLTCLRSPLARGGTFPRGAPREALSLDSPQLRSYARRVEAFRGRRKPSNVRNARSRVALRPSPPLPPGTGYLGAKAQSKATLVGAALAFFVIGASVSPLYALMINIHCGRCSVSVVVEPRS